MRLALGALALAAGLAGCGGSRVSDAAAIRAVLAASQATYLHYGTQAWGRQPHVRVALRIDGDRVIALVSADGATTQRITLLRNSGTWSIKPTTNGVGVLSGPRAERPATKAELSAISAAAEQRWPEAKGCVTYGAHVSTLDPRYASVQYAFPASQLRRPHGRCGLFVGNGEDIYVHTASGWRYVISGSQFSCTAAPAAVVRSLFGACFVEAS